jgi:hypothetical protein
MQEDDNRSSDKDGTEPNLSTKSNGQPAGHRSDIIMNYFLTHSSGMEGDMEQREHIEEMEYGVDDMEGIENMEEIYNVMNSSGVKSHGSEPVTQRVEAQRDLVAISEVRTPS